MYLYHCEFVQLPENGGETSLGCVPSSDPVFGTNLRPRHPPPPDPHLPAAQAHHACVKHSTAGHDRSCDWWTYAAVKVVWGYCRDCELQGTKTKEENLTRKDTILKNAQ